MDEVNASEFFTEAVRMVLASDAEQWHYWLDRARAAVVYAESAESVNVYGVPLLRAAAWHLGYEMQAMYTERLAPFYEPAIANKMLSFARKQVGNSMNGAWLLYSDLMNAAFAFVEWQTLADGFIAEIDEWIATFLRQKEEEPMA